MDPWLHDVNKELPLHLRAKRFGVKFRMIGQGKVCLPCRNQQ